MLNELYDLAQCLESARVLLDSWHPRFVPCPTTKTTYLALLNAEGHIDTIERLADRERIAAMRTWKSSENGVSFPGFNIPALYRPRSEESLATARELRQSLASKFPPDEDDLLRSLGLLIQASGSVWTGAKGAQLNKSLGAHTKDLGTLLGTPPSDYSAIAELIARTNRLSADALHHELTEILRLSILRSPRAAHDWFDILFFHSGQRPKDVSLILEVADRSRFAFPANHSSVQRWMNETLQARATPSSQDDGASRTPESDTFGNPATNALDKFPAARLPRLGNVILRSMAKDSRCQRRYGRIESDSCPVGHVSRTEMKNALEWIGGAERHDKTWSDISSLNGKASVLFVYPSVQPENAPELAGLIVGLDSDADPDGARFQACASRVTRALKGQAENVRSTAIRVFVLAKADTARTKVLQSLCFSAEHLLNSAREWEADSLNIPTIRVRRFMPKGKLGRAWACPLTPFPAELVSCLNTIWVRMGTHVERGHGFDVGNGLELLLERGRRRTAIALRCLNALLARSIGLLLAMGHAHHHGSVHSVNKKFDTHPLLVPSTLGLLLAKLGREKGDYMNGPPFLVGQLLSLADQLHNQYCHGVRNGQIPPQLVGNALMATALEQPTKALALLSQRILPYKAWATAIQAGESVGLTKYLLGQIGRTSAKLAALELPSKCTDTDRAEMLLGYLAHVGKEDVSEGEITIQGKEKTDE